MSDFPNNWRGFPLADGEVAYALNDFGGAGTTVWVHGFLENSNMWQPIWDGGLRPDGKHLFIDLPGHGRTSSFGPVHSMDFMAECIELALADGGIQGPVRVIGHSMGGYTALAYAERYPERINALMLYHSTAYPDSEEKKAHRDRATQALDTGQVMFVKEAVRNFFAAPLRDAKNDEIELATQWAIQTDPNGIAAALRGMRDRPDRRTVFTSAPRAHAVVGGLDPAVDARREIQFLGLHPEVMADILPQVGHMSHLEDSPAAVNALQQFLDRTA